MIDDKFGDGGDEDKDEHGNDAVECADCDGFDIVATKTCMVTLMT